MECGESAVPNVSCASEPDAPEMETIQREHAVLKKVPLINTKLFCLPEMLTRNINNRVI